MEDPLYVDAANDDLRIQSTSPMANSGAAVPLDLNFAAAGSFSGTSPDRGAFENF